GPVGGQVELARGLQAIAGIAEAGGGIGAAEVVLVHLPDAGATDRVGAALQPVAELGLHQHALLAGDARRDRQVIVGRGRAVGRDLNPEAVDRRIGEDRHQHAAFALHGRVGGRQVRHVHERHAEELDARILEIHHPFGLVVDDARRLHLPQRRLLGIVAARLAGGVDPGLEYREVAFAAVGAGGGDAGVVARLAAQRIDAAVAIVHGVVDDLTEVD